jgi:hypothetical protein
MVLLFGMYGCWHGYFDPGQFVIKQTQWSSPKQVAMVAERTDQNSLGGLTYFVLIGDHLFSPSEMRLAYHSDAVVFATFDNCLTLHWEGPSKLLVTCEGSFINQNEIDVQKLRSGTVNISYKNIFLK